MDGNSSTPCGSFTTNQLGINIQRICDGGSVQLYQAFTKCLPTITLRLANAGSGCPITLFVKRKKDFHRFQIEPNSQIFASFDCVKEVKVQCSDSPGGNCNIFGELQIHGCVSCG
ncbi:hypothetical protein AALF16_20545 [Bacillus cereus]|uniref:hypothetical protein n=1 Tax=Bacillus cereus TaxID=1396 RepID=UPI0035708C21